MHLTIPWLWMAVGELVYLAVAPAHKLRETLERLHAMRAPHPRTVMVLGMASCVAFWPIFIVFIAKGAALAVRDGFKAGK
jgi:hypothetical protein